MSAIRPLRKTGQAMTDSLRGPEEQMIEFWAATTGRFLGTFRRGTVPTCGPSPSVTTAGLLAGCDGHAFRLDAPKLTFQPAARAPSGLRLGGRFNRDDTHLITLAGDEYRKSGRFRSGTPTPVRGEPRRRHDLLVLRAAAFHPDGRLITTGDWQGKARLWDATSGADVGPVLSQPRRACPRVQPGGRRWPSAAERPCPLAHHRRAAPGSGAYPRPAGVADGPGTRQPRPGSRPEYKQARAAPGEAPKTGRVPIGMVMKCPPVRPITPSRGGRRGEHVRLAQAQGECGLHFATTRVGRCRSGDFNVST